MPVTETPTRISSYRGKSCRVVELASWDSLRSLAVEISLEFPSYRELQHHVRMTYWPTHFYLFGFGCFTTFLIFFKTTECKQEGQPSQFPVLLFCLLAVFWKSCPSFSLFMAVVDQLTVAFLSKENPFFCSKNQTP